MRSEVRTGAGRKFAARVVPVALVVAVAASVVNMMGSWIPSLWGDEAATQLSATRPLPSLFAMLGEIDIVHGLNYLAMHFWVAIAGTSPFALRLPSAVALGLCAAVMVWIGARVRSLPFGILVAVLTALLPRLTHAAVEARSYAGDALFSVVLVAIIVEVVRRRSATGWWVAYGVVLAVATATFLYLGLMTAAVGVMLWWWRSDRRTWLAWALASGVGLLAAAPVAWVALHERGQIAFLATAGHTNPYAILVEMWFVVDAYAWLAWTIIAVGLLGWLRSRPRRGGPPDPLTIAIPWALVPLTLILGVDAIHHVYTPRYLTFAAPAIALLLAAGTVQLARVRVRVRRVPVLAVVSAVAIICVTVPVWIGQRSPWSKRGSDWNDVAALIEQRSRAGDAIVFDESVDPSWRPRLAMDTNPEPFAGLRDVQLVIPYAQSPTWYAVTRSTADAIRDGALDGVARVWVVETVIDGVVSDDGIADLEAAGFHRTERTRINVSDVSLFTRTGE